MIKIDDELIQDRVSGTSFSFYTDKEIERISVKQILNPVAFDHLGNATSGGVQDKALGVSPFDHRSQCVTCGLDCNFCPGHVGHIELTAPVYNPFLFNYLYKLLKSKCQACHRIRIHPNKINIYVMTLKLLKAGQVIASQELKGYFLNAAKQVQLLSDQQLSEPKKLQALMDSLDKMIGGSSSSSKDEPRRSNLASYFSHLDKKFNRSKQSYEDKLIQLFNEHTVYDLKTSCSEQGTSILQKTLRELQHEIWSQVVSISCPHCHGKTPSYRKDGYTKIFQRPLSEKIKNQLKQQENVKKMKLNKAKSDQSQASEVREDAFEIITEASTRKESHNHTHTFDFSQSSAFNDDQDDLDDDAEDEENEGKGQGGQQKLLTPNEVQDQLVKMWSVEKELLDLMFGRYYPVAEGEPYVADSIGPDMFFFNKLLVPPNRFRPESQGAFGGVGGGPAERSFLHAHSAMISKILQLNLALKDALLKQDGLTDYKEERALASENIQKWLQLQDAINTFLDSSTAQKTADKEQPGIRQLLERKEGMFRMKMMGKRVNFGARSVISPDPYITTDQIGVPLFMAKKLTFPESVSLANVERLRKLVINGTHQHPGANMIEDEDTGTRTHLETLSKDQRRGLASLLTVGRKIVYRHLQNGDVLLVNRQPTLHKPSIMAHQARVLPKEQTIRMHYANCSTYNADFDGDEMNIHFPQSYLGASEGYNLMATHKQYIVPTSGAPIRGLIQDSVVSGIFMSSKDTFLTREQYQQLVYVGLRELIEQGKIPNIFTLTPAILKPRPMWTGKQVISTVLKNIVNLESELKENKFSGMNLDSKSKLPAKEWGKLGAEEGDVIIRDNELLQGTLDKNQYGSSEFGMVHCFYEIYGSEKAGELLTSLARLFTVFLQMHGFTCGVDDLVLTPDYDKKRRLVIEASHKEGIEAAAGFCGLKNYHAKQLNYSNRVVFQSPAAKRANPEIETLTSMAVPANPFDGKQTLQVSDPIRQQLEQKMNSSEDINKLDIELDNFIKNKMSGATSKILKECIPDGLLKRFPKNNISCMVLTGAKGGLVNMTQICCLLGQQELEGRRVPKMPNGKTLPCYLPYDPNPRSSGYISDRFISGLRPQDFFFHCMAGREGLIDTAVKTSRSGYLQRCLIKQLESLIVSYDMTVRDNDGSIIQFLYGEDGIDVMNTKFIDRFSFLESNFTSLMLSYKGEDMLAHLDRHEVPKYNERSEKRLEKAKKKYPTLGARELGKYLKDPVISVYHPLKYFGSISEKLQQSLKTYLDKDCLEKKKAALGPNQLSSKLVSVKSSTFSRAYYFKYLLSLAHPGENVGTIAAQSIGEPSTQMTLNTFHLAGHGAENMTLGIPRLKEILMTTPTKIKTPSMIVYFNKASAAATKLDKTAMEKFANKFKRLRLSDVAKEVKVSQCITNDHNGDFKRIYTITIRFEEMEQIGKFLGINFQTLLTIINDQFIPLLMNETMKQLRKAKAEGGAATGEAQDFDEVTKTGGRKQNAARISGRSMSDAEQLVEAEDDVVKRSGSEKSHSKKGDSDEEEDDNEEEDQEQDMGVVKKAKEYIGYEQEDEEDQALKKAAVQGGSSQEVVDEMEQWTQQCNLFKAKHQKYLHYMEEMRFAEDQSAVMVTVKFPLEFKKVLMLTIAEATLSKVLVRAVPGIDKCTLIVPEKEGEEPYMLVQGLNFDAFYPYADIVDVNRIKTNDIWKMMKKYGVEAGRNNLLNEIRSVFKMYGKDVNYRHLSLIADFITFNGEYRAFNRIGMEESSSPFLKMSFETTMKYLVGSCMTKDKDDMSTPSSALVLGQVPKVGTGTFEILHDPEVLPSY